MILQLWAGEEGGYEPPEDDVDQCTTSTNWTAYYDQPSWAPKYPYGAETTVSLPLDSDALYLTSKGPFQLGLVNIEQSSEVTNSVDVRVQVAYHYDELLEHATICQTERADGEYGVGIFVRYHLVILSSRR